MRQLSNTIGIQLLLTSLTTSFLEFFADVLADCHGRVIELTIDVLHIVSGQRSVGTDNGSVEVCVTADQLTRFWIVCGRTIAEPRYFLFNPVEEAVSKVTNALVVPSVSRSLGVVLKLSTERVLLVVRESSEARVDVRTKLGERSEERRVGKE